MTNIPEVSFCIPAYNSSARIERCLRAVLNQRIISNEILIVDNCSNDDTVDKAQKILHGIPQAKIVVNQTNIGRIENWNRCLELAAGRYIKFAFTNDVLLPGSTQILLNQVYQQPNVVMVCSRLQKVNNVPTVLESISSNTCVEVLDPSSTLVQFSNNGNKTGGLGGMLIQNESIRKLGLRFRSEIPFWSDFHFAIELAELGPATFVKKITYLFDSSVRSRYARSGIDKRTFYFEGRECARLLAKILPKYGIESWKGFSCLYLYYLQHCTSCNQAPLTYEDTLAVFRDAGPYLTSALKRHSIQFPQ